MSRRVGTKPIRSEAEHDAALVEIQRLWGAKPGSVAGDRLDVLVALVEAYERRQPPLPAADPVAVIRFQMEQRQLRNRDLIPAVGSLSRVSEILNRRRALTLDMIRRLQLLLDIPADVLVQPYRLVKARAQRGRPAKAA
jgi:HTH-type transcriptional regulator/antitoxin HigA